MNYLQKTLDDARKKNAELTSQLRELTFREAGIDDGSPWRRVLERHYDGPLEAEAMRNYLADEYDQHTSDPTSDDDPQEPHDD